MFITYTQSCSFMYVNYTIILIKICNMEKQFKCFLVATWDTFTSMGWKRSISIDEAIFWSLLHVLDTNRRNETVNLWTASFRDCFQDADSDYVQGLLLFWSRYYHLRIAWHAWSLWQQFSSSLSLGPHVWTVPGWKFHTNWSNYKSLV